MKTLRSLASEGDKADMDLKPIESVLGEDMPKITPTPLGRYRLIHSLTMKFGQNYRNIPKAMKALEHFDSEHRFFKLMRDMRK